MGNQCRDDNIFIILHYFLDLVRTLAAAFWISLFNEDAGQPPIAHYSYPVLRS